MKIKKMGKMILLYLILVSLLVAGIVSAADSTTNPSTPTTLVYISNATTSYTANGTEQNLTRGYIFTYNITESQPTNKWTAIVGNITAEYALQDASGYAIYDWGIVTTEGELYATRELTIPSWENLTCANTSLILAESVMLNHSTNANAWNFTNITNAVGKDEDAFQYTWNSTVAHTTFYAGDKQVTGCSGIRLMTNNSESASNWEEIIMMDTTRENPTGGNNWEYDIIYASLIN